MTCATDEARRWDFHLSSKGFVDAFNAQSKTYSCCFAGNLKVAMGFKLAVLLCLSFALAARAQIGTALANDLNSKENQLNCLVRLLLLRLPTSCHYAIRK